METEDDRLLNVVQSLTEQVGKLVETQLKTTDAIDLLANRVHSTRMALADTMTALTIAAKHMPIDDEKYQQVMDAILSAAKFFDMKSDDAKS